MAAVSREYNYGKYDRCSVRLDGQYTITDYMKEDKRIMKKIGLVGGTGPVSTLMYYKELNSRIDRLTGGRAMPDIAIESVDFRRAWGYVSTAQYDKLAEYLAEKVMCLKASGCEVIALTAATMHIVLPELEQRTGVQLVSIPSAVKDEAMKRGYRSVGLLGTIFTMEQDYMKRELIDAGINVIVPDKKSRDIVAKHIFEQLEMGIVKPSTREEFNRIISDMRENDGIEAVILGCTELPLLLDNDHCILPCIDSVDAHIEKLISLV